MKPRTVYTMMKKKLLDQLKDEIRRRNYSYSTEKSDSGWIVRLVRYHNLRYPAKLDEKDTVAFLNHLAVVQNVAASTQNQALSATLFLYEHVLKKPVGNLARIRRAKKPKRLPVVLSEKEAMVYH